MVMSWHQIIKIQMIQTILFQCALYKKVAVAVNRMLIIRMLMLGLVMNINKKKLLIIQRAAHQLRVILMLTLNAKLLHI